MPIRSISEAVREHPSRGYAQLLAGIDDWEDGRDLIGPIQGATPQLCLHSLFIHSSGYTNTPQPPGSCSKLGDSKESDALCL